MTVGAPELTTLEVTTLADDLVVFHDGTQVHRFDGLRPDTEYEFLGVGVRTLPRPPGERLATITTVNDVHFGEIEAGRIDDRAEGPIQRRLPAEEPYPELMNRAAVAEMRELDPDAVVVKGDLSMEGSDTEWEAFERCYRPVFGDRLHVVRGNHDAYHGQDRYAGDVWFEVPGLTVGVLDTVIPTKTTGDLRPEQLDRLDDELARRDGRVILMGHHQQWIRRQPTGPGGEDYFGMHPSASDRLDQICARRPNVLAYTAGHTHRHRVRPMFSSGVPSIEIGCVKDFPGSWAEYRAFEGGVLQVVHRISSPEALEWSERCRVLYSDFGVDYEAYAMGTLEQRCFLIPERAGRP